MSHPPFAVLLDYLEDALPAEARSELEEHLAGPCPQCAADLARLRAALDLLANDDTVAPPESALRRAVAAFGARPASRPPVRIPALLVFDNYRQASPAAVRGLPPARQLLFSAEGLDIDVQLLFAEDSVTLVGQILGGEQPASLVRLHRAGEVLDGIRPDAFGRFTFRPVPPGRYDLVVEFASKEVAIEGLDVSSAG